MLANPDIPRAVIVAPPQTFSPAVPRSRCRPQPQATCKPQPLWHARHSKEQGGMSPLTLAVPGRGKDNRLTQTRKRRTIACQKLATVGPCEHGARRSRRRARSRMKWAAAFRTTTDPEHQSLFHRQPTSAARTQSGAPHGPTPGSAQARAPAGLVAADWGHYRVASQQSASPRANALRTTNPAATLLLTHHLPSRSKAPCRRLERGALENKAALRQAACARARRTVA